jgi:hypothetical protein
MHQVAMVAGASAYKLRQLVDLLAPHARLGHQQVPRLGGQIGRHGLEAGGVLGDEGLVDQACRAALARLLVQLQQALHHALEQRQVAADAHLDDAVRHAMPRPVSISPTALGSEKLVKPRSRSGLMATTLAPRRAASCSAAIMRGWLVAGFWPITRIRSARSKSSSLAGALAHADGGLERVARGLVAEVGRIRQVGAAPGARHQLPQKGRLVAAAPRGIKAACPGPSAPISRPTISNTWSQPMGV